MDASAKQVVVLVTREMTFTVTEATQISQGDQARKLSDLKAGARVTVDYTREGDIRTARKIAVLANEAEGRPAARETAPITKMGNVAKSAPNLAPNTTFTLTFPDLPPTFDELGNPRQDHAMLMRMGGVPLVKGKCYQITFRIRSSELRQPVGVDIQDTNGWKHSGLNKAIRPGSDWTQGKFYFKNQNDMGDTARLGFDFLQAGYVDVADVKLVEIAAVPADRNAPAEVINPTNLVTNGDFSDVTNGVPTSWGTAGNKNNVDQVLTAEKDADGKPFARVTCTRLEHRGPGNKPMISVYLPKNYDTTHKFPLLVFLEGGTGGIGDQLSTPRALTQDKDFICVNMPLFKEAEAVRNQRYLFIDDPDAKFAWSVYKKMLARLDETVPNIDPAHRIIGGFSNGGHTTKGIINQSEGDATAYFTAFYFVESGAGLDRFDLLKGKPLFILYGAKNGGVWADRLFKAAIDAGVKAEIFAMPNTGHDFSPEGKAAVRNWLHETVLGEAPAEEPTDPAPAAGQPVPPSPQNRAIQVSVIVSRTPPTIQLSWPALVSARLPFKVYRKARFSKSWGSAIATLPPTATSWVDTHVAVGEAYEYMILGSSSYRTTTWATYGFIYAGIDVPMIDSRGKLVLVVDNTHAAALDSELARLQQDLVGDGWTVIRHDVSPAQTVTSVKALIQADYRADPNHVKSLLLFGHVPVPWSGNTFSINLEDCVGATEADVFYADMDGVWTDTLVNHTGTAFDQKRINNVPGDGKYDQSAIPSDTELPIGRVDLSRMPSFKQGERELLRNYLDKDHKYRTALLQVPRQGVIVDIEGDLNGGAYVVSGWRNYSAFFGASHVINETTKKWFNPKRPACMFGSSFFHASHTSGCLGRTADYATTDPSVVFSFGGGCYMGDWDYPDDLLRAPLCSSTYGLGAMFLTQPYLHVIALGDTIGAGVWLTQNADGFTYPDTDRTDGPARGSGEFARHIWRTYLGDPTLRLNPVIPPSNLAVNATSDTSAALSWQASTDSSIQGYHVYRASGFGAFTRLTPSVVTENAFLDQGLRPGTYTYMVRAVKLETSGSGAYFNPSEGIFQIVKVGSPGPAVAIATPLNSATYTLGSTVVIRANVSTEFTGSVDFYNADDKLATVSTAPYTYEWTNVTGGVYSLTARACDASGTTVSAPVAISVVKLPYELPAPWLQADIGPTAAPGAATITGDSADARSFRISGSGAGLSGKQDAYHAVYQPLNVNGTITARVASIESSGTAGVFLRDGLATDAPCAAVFISSSGAVTFSSRPAAGAAACVTRDPTSVTLPHWLRLKRDGDVFSAYHSSDGDAWSPIGTNMTIQMGSTPEIGLAGFSGNAQSTTSAVFTNVTARSPLLPPGSFFRQPYDGDAFTLGDSIKLTIEKPRSADDYFTGIQFFDDGVPIAPEGRNRSATWTPTRTGAHTVTAVIREHGGMVGSIPITLYINPAGAKYATVDITDPLSGEPLAAPCNLTATASVAAAPGTTITAVEFYSGKTLIGAVKKPPYSVVLKDIQPGNAYTVSARTIDNFGTVTHSRPVFLYAIGETTPAVSRVKSKD